MRLRTMIVVCAAAFFAGSASAQEGSGEGSAQPKESLSAFLARCDAGGTYCHDSLLAGFETAGDDMGIICPPDGLAVDDAVQQELGWLRSTAASNPSMAAGDEVDAEFDALNALWPCTN